MAVVLPQRYVEAEDIEKLQPHPLNAKLHDKEGIRGSIDANGFGGAVYAQESSGYILSGHGTVEAAVAEGMTTLPVIWIDCDDETAENLLNAYNTLQENAGYDDDARALLLERIMERGDYVATGYTPDSVDDFLAAVGRTIEVPPPDDGFRGDYADDATQREGKMPTGTTQQRGLREMVVVLGDEDYDQLMELVRLARGAFGTDTTGLAILGAMRQWNETVNA